MYAMTKERKKRKRKSAFAKQLQDLRERHDLTQVTAAERIGVATRTLISWENDQARPGRLGKILLNRAFPGEF